MSDVTDHRMVVEKAYSYLDMALESKVASKLEEKLGSGWIKQVADNSRNDRLPSPSDRRFLLSLFQFKRQTPETEEVFRSIGINDYVRTQLGNLQWEANKFAHQDQQLKELSYVQMLCNNICGILDYLEFGDYSEKIVATYQNVFGEELRYAGIRGDRAKAEAQSSAINTGEPDKASLSFYQLEEGYVPSSYTLKVTINLEQIRELDGYNLIPPEIIDEIATKVILGQKYIQVLGGDRRYNKIMRLLVLNKLQEKGYGRLPLIINDTRHWHCAHSLYRFSGLPSIFDSFIFDNSFFTKSESDLVENGNTCCFIDAFMINADFTMGQVLSFSYLAEHQTVEFFLARQTNLLDTNFEVTDSHFIESTYLRELSGVWENSVALIMPKLLYFILQILVTRQSESLIDLDSDAATFFGTCTTLIFICRQLLGMTIQDISNKVTEIMDGRDSENARESSSKQARKNLIKHFDQESQYAVKMTAGLNDQDKLNEQIIHSSNTKINELQSDLDEENLRLTVERWEESFGEPFPVVDTNALNTATGEIGAIVFVAQSIINLSSKIDPDAAEDRRIFEEMRIRLVSFLKQGTGLVSAASKITFALERYTSKSYETLAYENSDTIVKVFVAYKNTKVEELDKEPFDETPDDKGAQGSGESEQGVVPFDYDQFRSALKSAVIGQDAVIDDCVDVIEVDTSPLKQITSPTSFLFAGMTGTGKTYLAERIADGLGLPMQRFDMSEFTGREAINRLIGSPPGYVGSTRDAQLVAWVRDNPRSLLLFDEIDKTEAEVLDILLQILDKGEFSSASGAKCSLKDSIVICTTNAAQSELNQANRPIGFTSNTSSGTDDGLKGIRKAFRQELLNRFSKICVFNRLTAQDVERIVGVNLQNQFDYWKETFNLKVALADSAMRALCRLAYDDRSGAREVHRVISKVVIKGVIYLLSPDFEDKSVVITSSVDDVSDATRDELFESFVYEVE